MTKFFKQTSIGCIKKKNQGHSLLHIWRGSLSHGQKNTQEQVTEASQQSKFPLTVAPFGLADGARLVARDKE